MISLTCNVGAGHKKPRQMIGSLLQVKPLLHFVDKVIDTRKVRTRKKALKRVEDLLGEAVKSGEAFQASIIHANREEDAIQWRNELQEKYPNVEFNVSYFGPVIGTHLGGGFDGDGLGSEDESIDFSLSGARHKTTFLCLAPIFILQDFPAPT